MSGEKVLYDIGPLRELQKQFLSTVQVYYIEYLILFTLPLFIQN